MKGWSGEQHQTQNTEEMNTNTISTILCLSNEVLCKFAYNTIFNEGTLNNINELCVNSPTIWNLNNKYMNQWHEYK